MGTYYDEITDMQRAGKWKVYLCMSANGLRLDRQYRIYSAVREHYPEREYGYAEKFVRNELIINNLGGGIGRSSRGRSGRRLLRWSARLVIYLLISASLLTGCRVRDSRVWVCGEEGQLYHKDAGCPYLSGCDTLYEWSENEARGEGIEACPICCDSY